jgi:hypothetical protein
MSDAPNPRPEETEDESFERMMAKHSEPTTEVREAMADVEASRAGLTEALDELVDATHSALDIPAKVKRNPVKTAALVGGTGFLLVGGPRRVARYAWRRVRPVRPDPHAGILPPDVEKILKDAGVAKDPEVRRALNKDFADYLRDKGEYEPEPSPSRSFWRTFDRVVGPLGTAGARILVQRLMEAEQERGLARDEARKRATERAEGKAPTGDEPKPQS